MLRSNGIRETVDSNSDVILEDKSKVENCGD